MQRLIVKINEILYQHEFNANFVHDLVEI